MFSLQLPNATLEEPTTLPGGRDKAFRRPKQACCAPGTSMLHKQSRQSARTKQARQTDEASTVAPRNTPGGASRPLFRAFFQKPVSAESPFRRLFAIIFRPELTRQALPSRTGRGRTDRRKTQRPAHVPTASGQHKRGVPAQKSAETFVYLTNNLFLCTAFAQSLSGHGEKPGMLRCNDQTI